MDNKQHNNDIVEQFSKQAQGYTSIRSHSDALEKLIQISGLSQEDTVLEIACGSGIVSCEFAKHASFVTGIDITQKMLDQAKRLQDKEGLQNISWEIGDVSSLPYEDNQFSMVISRFGFHHFLNPLQVLKEMKRVCKPNGLIMLVDVSVPEDKITKYNEMEKIRDYSHVSVLAVAEFDQLFERLSLRRMETEKYMMQISLEEQLRASFPTDPQALEKMILQDIGLDELGINATRKGEDVMLNYPVYIFSVRKI
ncbi:methyltransferase domain-containing protein [Echinicola marina]|uniref:class I SAM-dependent methyltransferase n=1 Tax=Echinicola marina TaxID=2859768 RepID=UPI001CF6AAF4|nr:methyltransferase domain-containing protein [Echinicola marina]UCS92724.1 methyltransferase domain-containing protein [Echinicola marina]